jgi:hypothetical protein
MSENSILEEIIADLVDSDKSLVGPLTKLQYFAKRTKNVELLQYVLAELNGYKKHGTLPDYRITSALIHVDIQFGNVTNSGLEIPIEMLEENNRDAFRKFYLTDSVTVLEQMAIRKEDTNNESQYLVFNFPLTLIHLFQDAASRLYRNLYYRAKVVGVRMLGNWNIIPTALTSIRSRLLSFCMEIGDTFGYNLEIDSFNKSQTSNNEKIIHFMSTIINNNGDGNLINSGHNANIHSIITISEGNREQLNNKLRELGIDTTDIEELNEIIEEEKLPSVENKKLGNKSIDWITRVSGKALKGVGSIAKEVTSSLLANILMQYLGIPPIS